MFPLCTDNADLQRSAKRKSAFACIGKEWTFPNRQSVEANHMCILSLNELNNIDHIDYKPSRISSCLRKQFRAARQTENLTDFGGFGLIFNSESCRFAQPVRLRDCRPCWLRVAISFECPRSASFSLHPGISPCGEWLKTTHCNNTLHVDCRC